MFLNLSALSFLFLSLLALGEHNSTTPPRAEAVPLFDEGKDTVLFELKDKNGEIPTTKVFGVTRQFVSIELKKDPEDPSKVLVTTRGSGARQVQLFPQKLSLDELKQGLTQTVSVVDAKERVGLLTLKASVIIKLRYNPETGLLEVPSVDAKVMGMKVPLSDLTGTRKAEEKNN